MKATQIIPELNRFILADGMSVIFDPKRSEGAYFHDQISGENYIDLFSFFATQPIGFNHPKLRDPEFIQKMGECSLHKPSLSDVYTETYADSIQTFATIAGDPSFAHYFFVEGGALGNENAMKAAFDWKIRKNLAKGKGEKGNQIIHFKHAFHGRSGYTLSLTNTFDPKKYMYFPKFTWPRVSSPALSFPLTPTTLEQTKILEEQTLNEIKAALMAYKDDIAGLMIEPIQSEGGDRHFRPEFLQSLRNLADEEEFLLIFDEVQTGLGLTGSMWCFQQLGVTPDLLTFGKKAQVAGCTSTKRIDEIEENVFRVSSRINSTWGGNLIDFMRVAKYLEIIRDENLVALAKQNGQKMLTEMEKWQNENEHISNVRGRGLMIAFDLPSANMRDQFRNLCVQERILVLGCGDKSIRLRPHLNIPYSVLEETLHRFKKIAKQLTTGNR